MNKTKTMLFSKGKKDFTKFKFTFQDLPIDSKCLGVIFYFNGNLKHAANDLYNKGLKAFFSLRRKFSNFSELPFNISMALFDALINKNTKVRSFESSKHIRMKVDGPYFEISAKKASSVTL